MSKIYAKRIEDRAKLSRQQNYLPLSWLIRYPVDRNGRVHLIGENAIKFVDLADNGSTNGIHEKNRPDLYGVQVPNTEFYQAHFVSQKNSNKVIANSALDIYPLSGQRVKAIVNQLSITPYPGTAIVNYENLITQDGTAVSIIRLQEFLSDYGFPTEITCFKDLQLILKDPVIQKMFTPRGLDQLALSSFFIPNAIGETDANSRNILLVFEPQTGLIDSVIRIDGDKNLSLSATKDPDHPIIPKGIFKADESYNEFLGIIKNHKEFTMIDWELFAGYYELSKLLLTPADVRRAVLQTGYEINQGLCRYGYNEAFSLSPAAIALSIAEYEEFVNNIGLRASKIFKDVDQRIGDVHGHLPLEDSPYLKVDPFKTQLFDRNGKPIPVKDIPDGPSFC